jgi:hypothetical protein
MSLGVQQKVMLWNLELALKQRYQLLWNMERGAQ